MKKIWIILSLFLLFGCADHSISRDLSDKCDASRPGSCISGKQADMSGYKDFKEKNNQFITMNLEESLTVFKEKKSAILYYGFPECPWCDEALPIMNQVAKDNKLKIYYIDIDAEKSDDKTYKNQVKELSTYMSDYMEKDESGVYRLYVPMVSVVKNGVTTSSNIGTVDSHDAHERKMNDKEKEELKKIYSDMFQ
ncbi:MAG: glutaredoxin family protein [Erysipelotrichaceae bacterium]